MDRKINDWEEAHSRSFGRTSSAGSSLRRRAYGIQGPAPTQMDDDIESETVSQAGDIGDRALHSNRVSESGSFRLSVDNVLDNGVVVSIPQNSLLRPHETGVHDATANTISLASPSPLEIISPLSTDAMVHSADKDEDDKRVLPWLVEYISCLIHLAVLGILGALTRYLLQKLFGPGIASLTSDQSILYLDLPSNMVGSFLMGWWGVVFKGDISRVSDQLAIGLTTGYLGSLTTFSGWNQKMLDLSVHGQWLFSVVGFLIGLFLAAYSIIFGVETAKGFRWLLRRLNAGGNSSILRSNGNWKVDSIRRHLAVMVAGILILGLLYTLSGILEKREFESGSSEAELWLGCMVAPLGVWIRWWLARFNGRGLGKEGSFKWVPFGTLIANVSSACVMAGLSTLKKAVDSKNCDTIATGMEFGFCGCLSTVSTFIAEYNAMRESHHPWRAYAYAMLTIVISFGLGTLIYSVPVWIKGYD